jgi:hypothetical protein
MSFALLDYVKRAFPKARYVDASDMVDRIKVIKSAEALHPSSAGHAFRGG